MTLQVTGVSASSDASIDALKAYLGAPAHGVLGDLFTTATSAALSYDYDMRDVGTVPAEWVQGP